MHVSINFVSITGCSSHLSEATYRENIVENSVPTARATSTVHNGWVWHTLMSQDRVELANQEFGQLCPDYFVVWGSA